MIGLACRAFTSNLRLVASQRKGANLSGAARRARQRGNGWWMDVVRYFLGLVSNDAFLSLVLFWAIRADAKETELKGVEKQKEGVKRDRKKNSGAHLVCREAFPGVSAHQSKLITVKWEAGNQADRCECLGSPALTHRQIHCPPSIFYPLWFPAWSDIFHVLLCELLPECCFFCPVLVVAGVVGCINSCPWVDT